MAGTSPNLARSPEPADRAPCLTGLILAALPLLACGASEAEDAKPPNVLWIVTDQHRADVAGFAGDERAHTPSLDRFAAESVRVTDLYCQAPLCVPARQSMLTGQFAHTHGAFRNTVDFPPAQRTVAHAFAEAGFATALFGKTHCNTAGFEVVRDFKAQLSDFLAEHPDGKRPGDEHFKFRRSTESDYFDTMNPGNVPAGDGPRFFMEEHVVGDALAWLEQRDDSRPFFVWASFLNPHPPLFAPDEFRALFADADLPLFGSMVDTEPGLLPVHVDRRVEQALGDVDDAALLEITRAYYAALAWTDHCVGELLDGLEQLGLADDTLVIYTSDHGELLGQHGLLQKRAFYEGATRVPCLLRWPGRLEAGAVRDNVAQHVDLTATVLDLAGAEPPNAPAGRSMRALLSDGGADWEDVALSELSGTPSGGEVRRMVRLGRHKYVWHADGEEALFDLEADPAELVNLIDSDEHAQHLAGLRARFEAFAEATEWGVPRPR